MLSSNRSSLLAVRIMTVMRPKEKLPAERPRAERPKTMALCITDFAPVAGG